MKAEISLPCLKGSGVWEPLALIRVACLLLALSPTAKDDSETCDDTNWAQTWPSHQCNFPSAVGFVPPAEVAGAQSVGSGPVVASLAVAVHCCLAGPPTPTPSRVGSVTYCPLSFSPGLGGQLAFPLGLAGTWLRWGPTQLSHFGLAFPSLVNEPL